MLLHMRKDLCGAPPRFDCKDLCVPMRTALCVFDNDKNCFISLRCAHHIQLHDVSTSAVLQVARLGVSAVLVEDGVSAALLAEGLAAFEAGAAAVR